MYRIFVYGTLKKGQPNHDIMGPSNGKAEYVGDAETTEKRPLVIGSRYNIPYLLNLSGQGKNIQGEVYDVDDQMLAVLDDLEGHPTYYERSKLTVKFLGNDKCGKTESIWVYVLKTFKEELAKLPYLDSYDSKGDHGLEYVSRYDRTTDSRLDVQ
ncbi:gamma-glutamylaminecyclotransferase C-like [Glandiceps talaboti]